MVDKTLIDNCKREVIKRFNSIGYNVSNSIVTKIVETFNTPGISMAPVPMAQSKNSSIIYIDTDAANDMLNKEGVIMFYLAHEIAHIASGEDHEGEKFIEAVDKYNEKFLPKTVADPGSEYNEKYLPTFSLKDKMVDSAEPGTEAAVKDAIGKKLFLRKNFDINKYAKTLNETRIFNY